MMGTNTIENNILIVDDTPDNLRLLVELLTDQGYNIRTAHNGMSAIATIKKKLPDLILLDIMMPDINGIEVCQQIKQIEKTKDIPVIFMTALTENETKALAFRSGGNDYITKPIQTEEVLTTIKTHLQLIMLNRELIEKTTILDRKEFELEKKQMEVNSLTAQSKMVEDKTKTSKKYTKVNLPDELRKEYAEKLENFISNEKAFLNENISIPQIAETLDIPHHHLSMTINIEFNQNFYSYMNHHRIKYAETLLKDPEEQKESILMIAYRSGFQSKTSFNKAFKSFYGMPPREYRKKHSTKIA